MRIANVLLFPLCLAAGPLAAQSPRAWIAGVVRDAGTRHPVASANVFVLGTRDGALSDSAGRFRFAATCEGRCILSARRVGYREARTPLAHLPADSLVIELQAEAGEMTPVVVQAGRYATGVGPGVVLTPLEIVTIPGTADDVNRAIQTLPGVQQVDEGNGLFVRGGDFTETRVYLNDGRMLGRPQLQSSSGTFVGTLDPFLLDAVSFSSGGFGVRYGDALSAVEELHTQRRPEASALTLSAGLAALGADVAVPGPAGTGIRAVLGESDLTTAFRLNGNPRRFPVPPRGDDRTVALYWDYRPTARLSLFATAQRSRVATITAIPSVVDTFASRSRDRTVVLAWSDVVGRLAPRLVLSSSRATDADDFGAFRLTRPASLARVVAAVDAALPAGAVLRTGIEAGAEDARIEGSLPATGDDQRPGARVRLYGIRRAGGSRSIYQELDWQGASRFRLTIGARRDASDLARRVTNDPRVSAALRLPARATLTGAWGVYHQVVDPALQALAMDGTHPPRAMRARHAILGLQLGSDAMMGRVEVYDKSYADLAAQDRDFRTILHGRGSARGVDVLARDRSIAGFDARVAWSWVHAVRTDPSSGALAPAPADVTHGLTVIVSRIVRSSVTLGASFRYASGRPFTPVLDATRGDSGDAWIPRYATAGSDRLPAWARLDLSASVIRVAGRVQLVGYVAVTNALGRANIYTRRYSADYTRRYDVPSIFNRAVYVGGVLTLQQR